MLTLAQVSKQPFNSLLARSYLISQRVGGVYDLLASSIPVGLLFICFTVHFSIYDGT